MRFQLLDRIVELVPNQRLRGVKALSLAEEYLADHFPSFPVMPGVLMVEALVQSTAWLIRASRDFGPTVVLLTEARNVVYGQFVEPGRLLETEVVVDDWTVSTADPTVGSVRVRGLGKTQGETAVRARLTLSYRQLISGSSTADSANAERDARQRQSARQLFALLGGPAALRAGVAAAASAAATASVSSPATSAPATVST